MLNTIRIKNFNAFFLLRILSTCILVCWCFSWMTASVNEKKPRKFQSFPSIFFSLLLLYWDTKRERKNRGKRNKKRKIYMQMRNLGENARNSLKNKRFILFLYRKAIKKQFAGECVFTFENLFHISPLISFLPLPPSAHTLTIAIGEKI